MLEVSSTEVPPRRFDRGTRVCAGDDLNGPDSSPRGADARSILGSYFVNRAFQYYQTGEYAHAERVMMRAIGNNPKYLVNRGVLSILGHSTLNLLRNKISRS